MHLTCPLVTVVVLGAHKRLIVSAATLISGLDILYRFTAEPAREVADLAAHVPATVQSGLPTPDGSVASGSYEQGLENANARLRTLDRRNSSAAGGSRFIIAAMLLDQHIVVRLRPASAVGPRA